MFFNAWPSKRRCWRHHLRWPGSRSEWLNMEYKQEKNKGLEPLLDKLEQAGRIFAIFTKKVCLYNFVSKLIFISVLINQPHDSTSVVMTSAWSCLKAANVCFCHQEQRSCPVRSFILLDVLAWMSGGCVRLAWAQHLIVQTNKDIAATSVEMCWCLLLVQPVDLHAWANREASSGPVPH